MKNTIKKAVVGAVAVLALAACSSNTEDKAASTPEATSSTSSVPEEDVATSSTKASTEPTKAKEPTKEPSEEPSETAEPTATETAEPVTVDCSTADGLDANLSYPTEYPCLPGQDVHALSTLVNKPHNPDTVDWSLYCTNGATDRHCTETAPAAPVEEVTPYFPEDANPSDEEIQNERNAERLCSPSSGISEEERVELCFGGDADHDGIPDDEQ